MQRITLLFFSFMILLSFDVFALANTTQVKVDNQVNQKILVTIKNKNSPDQSMQDFVLYQEVKTIEVPYEKYTVMACIPPSTGTCIDTATAACPPDKETPTQITAASPEGHLILSCS